MAGQGVQLDAQRVPFAAAIRLSNLYRSACPGATDLSVQEQPRYASSIRVEAAGWDGKVDKFVRDNALQQKHPFIADGAHIQVHHYLASAWAAEQVTGLLRQYQAHQAKFTFIASFSHRLPPDIKIDAVADPALEALLKARYDPSVETTHTGKGIWLGYKQCGLPLVLDHNAPNNSVATLWARSDPKKDNYIPANHMSPLFPRRQRHSDAR